MGVDLYLETELGEALDAIPDSDGTIANLLPLENMGYPLLGFVDLYGNTVFNRIQMNNLIQELKKLKESSENVKQKNTISKIIKLAKRCENDAHIYLKFVGD
jgi:hypothetical protein